MIKWALMGFFKPGLWTVIILGVFVPVALLGHIQSYAFTCGGDGRKCVGTDIQKPPLYDEIRGYPFWLIWVFSIAPLIPFATAVQSTQADFMAMNFVYYYLVSCVVGGLWKFFRASKGFDTTQARI
ncbi:MAG: hypothetical protein ACREBU_06930 [Nitrososphaera sp.]